MRSLVVMAMFASSLTYAAWNGYTETRDLELSASGVDILEIDAGAGSILVTGVADSSDIVVKAIIRVPEDDEDDAQQVIAEDLVLKLEKKRSKAKLDAYFEHGSWNSQRVCCRGYRSQHSTRAGNLRRRWLRFHHYRKCTE